MKVKAKESPEILRARAKLKQHMTLENKKVNAKALQKMSKLIQHWISRHESDRVNLKGKSVKIFDENIHPAKTKSKYINHLLKNLNKPSSKPTTKSPLGGRVSG